MSDPQQDPSGNTQAFRAFAQQNEPDVASRFAVPLMIGGAVVMVVVAIVAFIMLA